VSLLDGISYGEIHLYQGVLIRYQSYCVDYACSFSGVAVSDSDGMGSSTQDLVARCTWAPAATSCCAMHLMSSFPDASTLAVPTQYRKPLGEAAGSPRASRARGKRRSGLTGGKIMSAHNYRNLITYD
jgi:hypothetical protein